MSVAEILPAVQALPRTDKLWLAQLLLADLAKEEAAPSLEASCSYPLWSQYDAYEAVPVLMRVLEEARKGA